MSLIDFLFSPANFFFFFSRFHTQKYLDFFFFLNLLKMMLMFSQMKNKLSDFMEIKKPSFHLF